MTALDATHDPGRRSWVASANAPDTDFPVQNLPLGMARGADGRPALSVAIGSEVLDVARAAEAGLLTGTAADVAASAGEAHLNRVLARPPSEQSEMRRQLADLLGEDGPGRDRAEGLLRPGAEVEMLLPCRIGSYSDFYAGIHHARAAMEILRPGTGLGENYKWVPIAYHSRATSVRPSGTAVRRPAGQHRPDPSAGPTFGPCRKLDFELELGFYVGAGNELGRPIPIAEAAGHIAGFCLLNDWSARDVQGWEMAPLGPFLSKSFTTTVSPWIVTADALRPFRVPAMPRPDGDPAPLHHLDDAADQAAGGLSVELTVSLQTERMRADGRAPAVILRSDARHLYWTPAQMVAHHTSNGCDLQPGDLLGTGTISGPAPDELGSMLELTADAQRPVRLPDGEERGYLDDGDQVTLSGRCVRAGYASIGFGPCTGTVVPAGVA